MLVEFLVWLSYHVITDNLPQFQYWILKIQPTSTTATLLNAPGRDNSRFKIQRFNYHMQLYQKLNEFATTQMTLQRNSATRKYNLDKIKLKDRKKQD